MSDYMGEPGPMDKIVPIVCGIILLAFFASVPSMIKDRDRAEAKLWHDNGCKMYDDWEANKVPAKCSSYFVDHYKAQQSRVQPPEAQ